MVRSAVKAPAGKGSLMATIDVLDAAGKKSGVARALADLFESPVSVPLMHQVVVAGLAGLRAGTHSTKTRGEVSGGGKKPWRQKGTGRARQGSIRSPQWVGGGVAHGPQPHDHAMRVNKKMQRGALRSALTDALQSGKLAGDLRARRSTSRRPSGPPSCSHALELDGKVSWSCWPEPTEDGAVEKSFRNLRGVKIAYAGGLGTYDLLRADRVLFTADALDAIEARGTKRDAAPKRQSKDETNEEVTSD